MSSGKVTHLVKEKRGFWRALIHWIRDFIATLVTGKKELERTCAGEHTAEMTIRVRTIILINSEFSGFHQAICDNKAFEASDIGGLIIKKHGIKATETRVIANIQRCLAECNYVNKVYARLLLRRDESYDSSNAQHEEKLEELWSNLKPGVRRSGRITKEWEEIGFQGTDPLTDFRSMGVLSLDFLVYFTGKYATEAREALVHSAHPQRWYPFSVAGINIASFLIELSSERLLDHLIYQYQGEHLDVGVERINQFFCSVFLRFDKLWVDSEPEDLMAFPIIFKQLKDVVKAELLEEAFLY